jgi:hypothetical protein
MARKVFRIYRSREFLSPSHHAGLANYADNGITSETSVMTGLAEWFQENSIPVKLLDLDTDQERVDAKLFGAI